MMMIIRRNKDTGSVKNICEYDADAWNMLNAMYNNRTSSTSTVEICDIPESAFETDKYFQRIVKPEYIRDVLEK